MSELVDKFVDYPINAHCAANELKLGVLRVAEDEVIAVEGSKLFSADAAGDLYHSLALAQYFLIALAYSRNVIHIWLLDHSRHRILHIPSSELIVRVLVPQKLQIKIGSAHDGFEEC